MRNQKVLFIVKLGVLAGLVFLLALTPLGYIRIGAVELTLCQIPVILGAVMMGPAAGAILGGFFGLTSLLQAITGQSAVFSPIFPNDPLAIIVLCFVPRILMGFLTGIIAQAMNKNAKLAKLSAAVAGVSGALMNTIFFIGGTILLLLEETAQVLMNLGVVAAESAAVGFWVTTGAVNGIPEAIVSAILVAAIAKAMQAVERHSQKYV